MADGRLVLFNDPHYSRTEPECREREYGRTILRKMQDVARVAIALKAEAVACTGDWFHRKGKVTFAEANDLLAVLSNWRTGLGLRVGGILGNHDIAGHSLDSLDNRAAGALVRSRVMQLLDREPLTSRPFFVTGTSYFHGCDSSDEGRLRMYGALGPEDHLMASDPRGLVHVHLCHGTLIRRGSFFGDHTVSEDLIPLLHRNGVLPDVIACGHLHYPEGIWYHPRPGGEGRRVAVCRIGSLARVSRDDLDRRPSCLVVAKKRGAWAVKEVPVEARSLDPREPRDAPLDEEHRDRIEDFVEKLREEADEWALSDPRLLLQKVVEDLGHDEEVLEAALKAVDEKWVRER